MKYVNIDFYYSSGVVSIDAGKGKLCAQILAPEYDSALDAELHRFLSGVLQVRREDINVTKVCTIIPPPPPRMH